MTEINTRKIKLLFAIMSALALAAGIFRTVLLFNYVEPDTGFYITGSRVGIVFNCVLGALVVAILACGILVRKYKAPEFLDSHSTVVVFSSAVCAFMYVTAAIYGVYMLVSAPVFRPFLAVQIALAIPCALNHVFICSKEVREKNAPQSLLGMSEALFFAVRTVEVFMDTKSQINTSQRSLVLVMLCAMMLFFMYEAKFQIRSEESKQLSVANYFMCGIGTVALTMVTVLPYLAVCLFWHFESSNIIMDVLECCIMIYAASRMLTLHGKQ